MLMEEEVGSQVRRIIKEVSVRRLRGREAGKAPGGKFGDEESRGGLINI